MKKIAMTIYFDSEEDYDSIKYSESFENLHWVGKADILDGAIANLREKFRESYHEGYTLAGREEIWTKFLEEEKKELSEKMENLN